MISIIVAVTEKGVIGRDGQLPWKIKADLKRFKKITTGHPVIMGRKTYESIGRPLPERLNIVITRNPNFKAQGCMVLNSLEKALEVAQEKDKKEVFVIGGGEIYREVMPLADKLYVTIVHKDFEGDVYFPSWSDFSKKIYEEKASEDGVDFTFLELER